MDRLPSELLEKICADAGVGYFPALRLVSRKFNQACDAVSNRYEAARCYPARLDHYSVADLARLGHLDLLRGMTLSKDEKQQVCAAAFISGQLDVLIAYRRHARHLLRWDFIVAAREGHANTINYYVDEVDPHIIKSIASAHIKVGCLERLRLNGYLPEGLHRYLPDDVLLRYQTLYPIHEVCPDIDIQEQLVFAVQTGRLVLANECLEHGADLGNSLIEDSMLKDVLTNGTVETVRWCMRYLQRTRTGFEVHRFLKGAYRVVSRAASEVVLPMLLEFGWSPPPLYVAIKWGVPALSLLHDADLDALLLDLYDVTSNIDCIRYCIANGATTCWEASERAALAKNWKVMYICRAAAKA